MATYLLQREFGNPFRAFARGASKTITGNVGKGAQEMAAAKAKIPAPITTGKTLPAIQTGTPIQSNPIVSQGKTATSAFQASTFNNPSTKIQVNANPNNIIPKQSNVTVTYGGTTGNGFGSRLSAKGKSVMSGLKTTANKTGSWFKKQLKPTDPFSVYQTKGTWHGQSKGLNLKGIGGFNKKTGVSDIVLNNEWTPTKGLFSDITEDDVRLFSLETYKGLDEDIADELRNKRTNIAKNLNNERNRNNKLFISDIETRNASHKSLLSGSKIESGAAEKFLRNKQKARDLIKKYKR